MSWNYRYLLTANDEHVIIEVYYDDDGEIEMWSGPVGALGDTPQELTQDLTLMLEAADKPVLSHEELARIFAQARRP